jgi:hypothetical protein
MQRSAPRRPDPAAAALLAPPALTPHPHPTPSRPLPQISAKVDELLRLLAACPDEASKNLTCLTLATRMVSQCDSQVGRRGGGGTRHTLSGPAA